MFKNLWKYFRHDQCWKNIMKICVIYSANGIITFWGLLIILIIIGASNNFTKISWDFYKGFIFIFQSVFISYSLSIFVVNSNEIQQQKYRFLWLFLFFLALNIIGIISILMLMKKQKTKNEAFM